MKFLSRKELKLFITFFFVYAFFVHWTGWVENSHFDLTRAIADEGRIQIDSFYSNTGDRAYFNSNYYSNKAPGLSFLATPVYAAWKFVFYNFFPGSFIESKIGADMHITNFFSGIPIITYVNPGFFAFVSMILVTVFTSSLFSALTVVLIYKISKYFTKNEKQRILITLTYGLGTLAFPFATVFFSHAAETFFIFLAFYLLFKIKKEKSDDARLMVIAGISAGFAVAVDYSALLILAGLFGYLFTFKRKGNILYFVLGCIIGLLPLLLYNLSIFGNPFETTVNYSDASIFPPRFQLALPSLSVILQMLIFPYRGLFFYYPILILSFIGLFYMHKEHKAEAILIALVFSAFLLLFSMVFGWWGGTSFGLRYMLPVMPFLMLPLFYVFRKIDFRIILLLAAISVFANFLGMQPWENAITAENSIYINNTYQEQVDKFQFSDNPLHDYYLPKFLENGPRSRILESLANGNMNIDIRDSDFSKTSMKNYIQLFAVYPLGFVALKIPFLSMLIAGFLAFVIWRKEIIAFLKRKIGLSFRHKAVFIILFLVLFAFLFIGTSNTLYKDNWYPLEGSDNLTYRWMSQNATILAYNPSVSLAKLNLIMDSYPFSRNLDIFVNDNFVGSYNISENGSSIVTPIMVLNGGENKILFHSRENCTEVYRVANNTDARCLSFALRDSNIAAGNKNIIEYRDLGDNWYGLETENNAIFRWMSQDAAILIINPNNYAEKIRLDFIAHAFYKTMTMQLYLNNKLIEQYNISKGMHIITPVLDLKPGENTILFRSKEGCDAPSKVGNSTDSRCLSFAFENIKVDIND